MTIKWCMVPEIWSVTDIIFCHFGSVLPFCLPSNPKNQNFEKMKKAPGDIIYHFYTSTINGKHIMYGSWDIERDGCFCYFSFWTIFCPFTPLTAPKLKISKKRNKCLEMSSCYTSVPKIITIRYTVPLLFLIVISHFGLSFTLSPP